MDIERVGLSEWGDALPDSGFEVFHLPGALRVLDDHTDGELQLFVGYNGSQAVAFFPAMVTDRTVGRTVTSPPPSMNVPKLGPLVSSPSPKRRKQEQTNKEFVRGVRDELDLDDSRTVFRFLCSPAYGDPRPYIWDDDAVSVSFTYRLDLADRSPDEALTAASKSLRRSVRDGRDLDVSVSVEGVEAARRVFDQTKERYEEQGRSFTLSWPYVKDLVTWLDERARVYVVRGPDDEFLSGIVALFSNDDALYWLGGTRADYDGTSVNALLHWRIVEDVAAGRPLDSLTGYDLMGADTERLSRYKSKFGADLVPYHVVESKGAPTAMAKRVYEYVRR
ncbi:GNAT family N-acetyltransferase [Haloarchaeobius litoreus]|uniref:GNAT family N-acetyltransferase n=1 Tax=Haloarchaeobius litoreus TaxID=755306 RepID=A0ABD6DQV3_9EURY|nr:GNAT family N-acetyltransferase [Haloarchaeobius litoreus]